jgi:hypothetical protein
LVVIYFGERADDDELLAKVDLADQVTAQNVVCVRAKKPAETKAPAEALLATPRLESTDLWAAYGVTEADTFIVTDMYGNPFYTGKETALEAKIKEVSSHFRGVRKQLRKKVEAAQTAKDKGDIAAAVEALKEGLKLGLTGYSEAESAAKLYKEMLEAGRKQLKEAGSDAAKLDALAKTFAGTDLESDIKAARKAVN